MYVKVGTFVRWERNAWGVQAITKLLNHVAKCIEGISALFQETPCLYLFLCVAISFAGCKDKGTNPNLPANEDYELCYEKQDQVSYHFQIFLNNSTGTQPKNISNIDQRDDEDPAWSPDGNYIAFSRDSVNYSYVCLYNVKKDTITYLTGDSIAAIFLGMWTPDNRVVYSVGGQGMWISNVDGTNNHPLKYTPSFFYQNSFDFITIPAGSYSVYRSNTEGTIYEFILDLKTIGRNYVHVSDLNTQADQVLILADPIPQITNLLVTYDISGGKIDTVSVADSGWMYVLNPKFSQDCRKIAAEEVNYTDTTNETRRVVIFDIENHTKMTLVEFPSKDNAGSVQFIGSSPLAFSPHDQYLAFVKNVTKPGTFVSSDSYLYIVDLASKQTTLIDNETLSPSWNPLISQ